MAFDFDFKAMQDKMAEELASTTKTENSFDSEYPLVYVGNNGKLTVKLLANLKMGGLQRKLLRHPADAEGKAKVPCMSAYGETCPICEAIRSIEQAKGKEIGAYRKYGYKIRCVCYAQIIDHDATYFTEQNDPKKKDVVMLMYPKTVYDQLNKIMVDAGSGIEKVLGMNTGIPVIIEKQQKGKEIPKYTATFDAFHEVSSFNTDEEFVALLNKLPSLEDAYYPSMPTAEIRSKVQAVAEAITQEYLCSSIVNPTPKVETKTDVKVEVPSTFSSSDDTEDDDLPFEVGDVTTDIEKKVDEVVATSVPEGKPSCFSNHEDSEKCSNCIHECDCVLAQG